MRIDKFVFICALATPFALGATSSSESIEKAFLEYGIIPDVLKVAPEEIANVTYGGGASANLGNELKPTQVKGKPTLTWEAEGGAYYSLLMVDPDVPSRSFPIFREYRHWLVMNIPGTSIDEGDEVIDYQEVGPPNGTGLHRYTFMIFQQPNGTIEVIKQGIFGIRLFTKTSDFTKKYKFGNPKFGNFFTAQYNSDVNVLQAKLRR